MAFMYLIPLNSICWGYLGCELRVVLPSCAVSRIRQHFHLPVTLDLNCKTCNLQQVTMTICM